MTMKHLSSLRFLVFCIAAGSAAATLSGILSHEGPGPWSHETVRGESVTLYGQGLYQHMSAEVAIQGIAQDYVTLCIGIPVLLAAMFFADRSRRARFVLAGTLGYFLVTYLFYLTMGMFNYLFLLYAFLLGTSFFAFTLTLMSFSLNTLPSAFTEKAPVRSAGGFLLFNAFSIALLWLGVVIPPLLQGAVYPKQVEHYTTLIVQGMDLGLLLPLSALSGVLLMRKTPWGFLLGPVYCIFLSILMAALTAKIAAMGMAGYDVVPVIFVIPAFNILALVFSLLLLRSCDARGGRA